jgi:predicted acylesterase/phospholipase RssA
MRVLCVLLLTLVVTGCVFSPKMHYDIQTSATAPPQVTGEDDRLLGIALSGGGSRAALFAAAGMEALWEHGLLDSTDYISSVSGGSIAASYYFKMRAVDGVPLDGQFFDRFKTAMRHDFYNSMEWRQCYKVRWLSSTRRSSSLQEVLDKRFLNGLTLGELGDETPRLLINATVYDSGRRFVFTTLGTDEVGFDFSSVDGITRELADRPAIRTVTFTDDQLLGSVPVDFPVSLAVAASAAVPLLMGPVTIQMDSTYLHLGDGGLFDNSGTETLEQVILRKLQVQDGPTTATVFAFDSGFKTDQEELAYTRKLRVNNHPNLLVDIPTARAEAYRQVVRHAVEDELSDHGLESFVMDHTSASLDPHLLPASCSEEKALCSEERCREAIEDYIARVPTHLKIKPCAADLIELAAHAVVHRELEARFPARHACRLEP